MTALIGGIDLSTRELTAALIPLDADHGDQAQPPIQFRAEPLPKTSHLAARYRDINYATRSLLTHSVTGEVVLVYVEEPRGPFATRALNGVFGAVLASIPKHIQADYIDPQEWRRELGLPRNIKKPAAVREAQFWIAAREGIDPIPTITEHQAEALLIALAGRQINNRHFRGAA